MVAVLVGNPVAYTIKLHGLVLEAGPMFTMTPLAPPAAYAEVGARTMIEPAKNELMSTAEVV
jgi:hypothetical protein